MVELIEVPGFWVPGFFRKRLVGENVEVGSVILLGCFCVGLPVVGKTPTRQNPDFFPLQNPTTFDKIGFFFYKNGKISAKKV